MGMGFSLSHSPLVAVDHVQQLGPIIWTNQLGPEDCNLMASPSFWAGLGGSNIFMNFKKFYFTNIKYPHIFSNIRKFKYRYIHIYLYFKL